MHKHTAHSGLTASENAIWMLVVAVREHSFALMKKIMSNDKDFGNGYAPRVPNHFQTSLAFPRIPSEKSEHREKRIGKESNTGKRVINSICLSHILAENPCAASRLTSMYSVALNDWRGSAPHAGIDIANYLINSSIQRAASRRQMISKKRQSPAGAISKSTLTSPNHNMNVSSSEHSGEISVKAQRHSTKTSATSIMKSTKSYPAIRSRAQLDKSSVETQLHSTQTFPATWLPLNMPQLVSQRMDHHITPPLLQSQLSLPSMSSRNTQSPYSMQMINQTTEQHMQPSVSNFIPNSVPLANAGFPEIMNTHKGSQLAPIIFTMAEQPQNSAILTNASYPSSTLGSKDFAALLAMPMSQPVFAGTESNSSVENRVDKATLEESNLRQEDRTIAKKTVANDEKDDVEDAKPIGNLPLRPRGRGFGAKNLAALRARASVSGTAKSSFSDSGK